MQIFGKTEEYFFTYKYGELPEAYCLVNYNDIKYVCIIESAADPEELNKMYNEKHYYSFEGEESDADKEIISTLPYAIQDEFEIADKVLMVTKWNDAKDVQDIFIF